MNCLVFSKLQKYHDIAFSPSPEFSLISGVYIILPFNMSQYHLEQIEPPNHQKWTS